MHQKTINGSLTLSKKISLIIFLVPFFIGSFLEEKFGIRNFFFYVLIFMPFYFIDIKTFIERIKSIASIKFMKYLMLFLGYSLFTLSYSIDPFRGGVILSTLIFSLIIGVILSDYFHKDLFKYFAWSSLIYIIFMYLDIPRLFFNYYSNPIRFGYTIGDINLNPNTMAVLLLYIIAYFAHLMFNTKKIPQLIVSIIPLLIAVFLLLKTQSRTGFFTLLLILLLTLLIKRRILNLVILSVLITSTLTVFLISSNMGVDNNNRLTELDLNKRDEIWSVAFASTNSRPMKLLFGYGMGSAESVIGNSYDGKVIIGTDGIARASAHNLYIETLLNSGIFGLLLLILFLYHLFKNVTKKFSYKSSFLPVMVTLIIITTGLSGNPTRSYYYVFILAYLVSYSYNKKENLEVHKLPFGKSINR